LWFLIRSYGLAGLRERIDNHVSWSCALAEKLREHDHFELVPAPILSLFTFKPAHTSDQQVLDYVQRINDDGRIYVTQTRVDGQMVVRFQVGQFDVIEEDIDFAFTVLCDMLEHRH
jgi:aromatic-L-amino-acid decarboxylase